MSKGAKPIITKLTKKETRISNYIAKDLKQKKFFLQVLILLVKNLMVISMLLHQLD